MENKDQPIYPVGNENYNHPNFIKGLTKREYFAGLAMQGLIRSDRTIEWIVNRSVDCADELLKRLEN
jgi:hypothetical protein